MPQPPEAFAEGTQSKENPLQAAAKENLGPVLEARMQKIKEERNLGQTLGDRLKKVRDEIMGKGKENMN